MIKTLKKFFLDNPSHYDPLVEGMYAHQYSESAQAQLRKDYLKRWSQSSKLPSPATHPWMFDPCEPPVGWAYDPYYEIWIQTE